MMIPRLTLKKFLISFSAVTIYFIYFNTRFGRKNRRKVPQSRQKSQYETFIDTDLNSDISEAIKDYRTKRNIYIKYPSQNTLIQSSIDLMENYNINLQNFNEKSLLDICKDDTEECNTSDIRAFIYAFFKEVTKDKEIFQNYQKKYDTYLLKKDSKGILKEGGRENIVKALGLMLSLAIVTETFLDIEFSLIFLSQNSKEKRKRLLDDELYWYDSEQNHIYSSIVILYGRKEIFGYDPNSSKPFIRFKENKSKSIDNSEETNNIYNDTVANSIENYKDIENNNTNNGIELYEAKNYPIDEAAKRLFLVPFEKSTELIDQSTQKFFGKSIVNVYNLSYGLIKEECFTNQIGINFITLFKGESGVFDPIQWRDNSIYDSSTRMFWKALKDFKLEQQLKIFLNITGLGGMPGSGFERLPKTVFKASPESEIKFIAATFELWLPSYSSLEQMKTLLNKYI